jgi:isopenicillin N synthase-like dioxygenase
MTRDVIPTVDLTQPDAAQAIDRACRDAGFFYLRGHGLPDSLLVNAFRQSALFFALPETTKNKYHISHAHPH